jgi:hypothetical protein
MSPKVTRVLKVFLDLTAAERTELIASINKFQQGSTIAQEAFKSEISESFGKSQASVNFGPAPGGCPYCGR